MRMWRCVERPSPRLPSSATATDLTASTSACRTRTPIHIRIQTRIPIRIRIQTRASASSSRSSNMIRTFAAAVVALLTVTASANEYPDAYAQTRTVRELTADLTAQDPVVRARAACEMRELGDGAADAIQTLTNMLGDAAPVEPSVCSRSWWRGNANDLTSPGEQAAAALVAIGTRAFQPVLGTLRSTTWTARRNAAWALGALDDQRAVDALVDALKDREPAVREQVAWALGAIDDKRAVQALIAVLKDPDPRVRRQAAWALGAIDDPGAADALSATLGDTDEQTRAQAAWRSEERRGG